jgi:hypothetical protein
VTASARTVGWASVQGCSRTQGRGFRHIRGHRRVPSPSLRRRAGSCRASARTNNGARMALRGRPSPSRGRETASPGSPNPSEVHSSSRQTNGRGRGYRPLLVAVLNYSGNVRAAHHQVEALGRPALVDSPIVSRSLVTAIWLAPVVHGETDVPLERPHGRIQYGRRPGGARYGDSASASTLPPVHPPPGRTPTGRFRPGA